MDERVFKYKAGDPIPDWDWQHRLPIDKPVSGECKDTATVFRINSTFMDITDQPYMDRQWVGGGVIFCCLGIIGAIYHGYSVIKNPNNHLDTYLITTLLLVLVGISAFGYLAFKYGRDEFFALRRRPIRFNRREKKIYAIRRRRFFATTGQGDITWEMEWNEKSIFCIHRGYAEGRPVYHIRHYEVDNENKVIRSVAIGRKWEENENLQGLLSQWNYWCWYMNYGPGELPKPPLFFSENESMRESFLFCLYGFGMQASIAYRISMMPFILIMTGYRLFALWTCRNPVWPQEVEDVSVIDPNDPYDEPQMHTPIGWGETVLAKQRGDYPEDPKMEIMDWRGERDPAVNALLWAQDIPPTY
ncbi:hypothetical protein HBDW_35450 [Herbaspirillum sp. DW155]|uniref:DUF6708 domain-containing protein n=1 Tax=Herbaspirillum sp. DW155 TaxID=3095609 RepID=UPI00308C5CBE|nr:hypothetical protein HBDW_35450 [Herbaspirillum sp. DW155]